MALKISTPFSQMLGVQKRLRRILNKSLQSAEALTKRISPAKRRGVAAQVLTEITGFGTNPGRLTMKLYVPPRLAKSAPLVVVLHGCQQTPEGFDAAAGFGKLARERRFALLYPQQRRSNNSNLCFNWFRPSAVAHDRGEAMSIRQMIEFSCKQHALDRSRIYVVGLSAGGAMAGSLAFSYPHLFAGVAIVAGLPVSSARDVRSAISVMQSGPKAIANGRDLVRAEPITLTNRLPTVSVWKVRTTGPSTPSMPMHALSSGSMLMTFGLRTGSLRSSHGELSAAGRKQGSRLCLSIRSAISATHCRFVGPNRHQNGRPTDMWSIQKSRHRWNSCDSGILHDRRNRRAGHSLSATTDV